MQAGVSANHSWRILCSFLYWGQRMHQDRRVRAALYSPDKAIVTETQAFQGAACIALSLYMALWTREESSSPWNNKPSSRTVTCSDATYSNRIAPRFCSWYQPAGRSRANFSAAQNGKMALLLFLDSCSGQLKLSGLARSAVCMNRSAIWSCIS